MATSIEERILDLMESKLEAISVGTGGEQSVVTVTRASQAKPVMQFTTAELPGLQIRHIETATVPHLRGALECQMNIEIICAVVGDAADEALSDLIADVLKVLEANKRWDAGGSNFLARRTWIVNWGKHEDELPGPNPQTGFVTVAILIRVDATNPFAVKEI
jgi:hypothetical protein